ncbi:urease accessory protein UreE [Falsiroseomonas sp.]|uniref:urease accessory protein UreE n=1 Tax=Falsiroseomonas sp. TaxID=2870721 RepID=UPI003F7282D8
MPQLRAIAVHPAGSWPEEAAKDTVTVDFDDRFRRRKVYLTDGGGSFLLDLAEATVMRDGDGLELESGGFIRLRAAAEDLVSVTAATPALLLRLAWHLGNRHLPTELDGERILIRHDHVIIRMLEGLGATLQKVRAPFNPEGGAYGEHNRLPGHPHGHHHHHGDDDHHHHDH